MTIAFGSIGAKSAGGTTTITVPHPASIAAQDCLVCGRVIWTGSNILATNEGGWIKSGDLYGGTGAANDAHTARARSDIKIANGIENNLPNQTVFDQSGTLSGAMGVMARYTKASNKVWATESGLSVINGTGDDATHAADRSITTAAMELATGDWLVAVVAVDTDAATTILLPTFTAPGITFGTVTQRTSGAGVITGNDGNVELFDVPIAAGSGTVAVTFAFTTTTTQCGPVSITRLREADPFYPSLLDGVEPETHSRMNVIQDGNGNLYRFTESYLSNPTDYQNQPQALKSTDGGLTWAEQDAVNRPGRSGSNIVDLESFAYVKDGTGIACINQGSDRISYMRFRTSDHATNPDTWETTVREDSATVQAPSPAPQYVSITNPPGQAYDWLIWQATGGRYRSRTNSTTFGTITNIDGTAALFPAACLDSADVTWIFYKKTGTPNQLHYKKLTGAGVLDGTSTRVDTNGISAHADHVVAYAAPVAYDVGGDKVQSIIFTDTNQDLKCVDVVNGTPGAEQTITTDTIAGDEGTTTSLQSLVALAVDGTDLYAVWVDTPNWDIRYSKRTYGGSWSAPVNLYTTGTTEIAYVTAAIVSHSGTKYLGYTYDLGPHGDDDANILYNRLALSSPVTGVAAASFGFTGAAAGVPETFGTAAGSFGFTGAGAGIRETFGTAAASLGFTGAALGVDRALGVAVASLGFTGSASGVAGTPPVTGVAAGLFGFTGTAAGIDRALGAAAASLGFTGAAAGIDRALGLAVASLGFTGTASGVPETFGVAGASFGFTGTAAGTPEVFGVAVAALGFTGSASGVVGSAPVIGVAVAAFGFTGSASGVPTTQGAAVAVFGFTGTAAGVDRALGVAVGLFGFTGSAAGIDRKLGVALALLGFTGTASGSTAFDPPEPTPPERILTVAAVAPRIAAVAACSRVTSIPATSRTIGA